MQYNSYVTPSLWSGLRFSEFVGIFVNISAIFGHIRRRLDDNPVQRGARGEDDNLGG